MSKLVTRPLPATLVTIALPNEQWVRRAFGTIALAEESSGSGEDAHGEVIPRITVTLDGQNYAIDLDYNAVQFILQNREHFVWCSPGDTLHLSSPEEWQERRRQKELAH